MNYFVASLSLAAALLLAGCATVTTSPVQPPRVAASWTSPHDPIYDAAGNQIGWHVSAFYIAHFADLAKRYGSRLSPPLSGSEGMSKLPNGWWCVSVDRDELNESLARWARNAYKQ